VDVAASVQDADDHDDDTDIEPILDGSDGVQLDVLDGSDGVQLDVDAGSDSDDEELGLNDTSDKEDEEGEEEVVAEM